MHIFHGRRKGTGCLKKPAVNRARQPFITCRLIGFLYLTHLLEFLSLIKERNPKPKGVTTQMKALDEYILMVLFVLLLKKVHFLANET